MNCLARRARLFAAPLLALCTAVPLAHAASAQPAPATASYADVATHAAEAATIIDARIRRTRPVELARATGLRPGHARFYVEGEVNAVLFGNAPVARRIAWLVDLPAQANGRAPAAPRGRVLLFARPVATSNQLQLVAPSAQLPWDASAETHARSIAAELAAGSRPPAITRIARAFHVPGTVAGEGETQVFLETDSGTPVSLTVLRRPGQPRHWGAAFGEIVDESAAAPAIGTLAHFRLACGLPVTLPATAIADLSPADAALARDDYGFVRQQIGPCGRRAP